MLFRSSTGMPVADAHDDLLRARRAQVAARAARLEVIPLKTIVGTVEPTLMYAWVKPVRTVSASKSAEAA
jgi:hypothetical protein